MRQMRAIRKPRSLALGMMSPWRDLLTSRRSCRAALATEVELPQFHLREQRFGLRLRLEG